VDPLASAAALGFVLGLQHATDADHLVAVATIVSRERRVGDGVLVGLAWGLGHMTTLTLAGLLVVALNLRLTTAVGTGLELAVAAMLVGLGALRLRDALRAPIADHDHGGVATLHAHGGGAPHVHPSRPLLAAFGGGRVALAARAVGVGAVHGMAGSAAVSLLVLTTLHTTAGAVVYLAVFGLGTLAGMTALTAAMAYPVSLALRLRRARTALGVGAGLGSIAFGLVYAASAF
jgi:high-affinity nickel-transport protein